MFDYDPRNDDELKVRAGDILQLVREESPEWWNVNLEGQSASGLVPASYVTPLVSYARAIYAYDGKNDDASAAAVALISFSAGELIAVTSKDEGGWWEGVVVQTKRRGVFPYNYVELVASANDQASANGSASNGTKPRVLDFKRMPSDKLRPKQSPID